MAEELEPSNRTEGKEALAKHRWWRLSSTEILSHIVAGVVISALGWPISYYGGKAVGERQGHADALKASEGVAKIAAQTASQAALSQFTSEMVRVQADQMCKADLEKLKLENDRKLQLQIQSLRDQSAQLMREADTLGRFFTIFKQQVAAGAAAAKEGKPEAAMQAAEQILMVQRIGRDNLAEMAFKVLNHEVTELATAYREKNSKRVIQLLIEIQRTVDARDAAFKTVVDNMRSVK